MSTRVLLIRAINVGGATVPMAALRELATQLGAEDVRTFIASGNLICRPPGDAEEFDRGLERALEERFGFFREVISRTPDELAEALAAFPFDRSESKFCHVYFLSGVPAPEGVAALVELTTEDVAVIGRDLHLRYRDGVAGTKLTTPRIHRTLGVVGTGRNLDTVRKLVDLARG